MATVIYLLWYAYVFYMGEYKYRKEIYHTFTAGPYRPFLKQGFRMDDDFYLSGQLNGFPVHIFPGAYAPSDTRVGAYFFVEPPSPEAIRGLLNEVRLLPGVYDVYWRGGALMPVFETEDQDLHLNASVVARLLADSDFRPATPSSDMRDPDRWPWLIETYEKGDGYPFDLLPLTGDSHSLEATIESENYYTEIPDDLKELIPLLRSQEMFYPFPSRFHPALPNLPYGIFQDTYFTGVIGKETEKGLFLLATKARYGKGTELNSLATLSSFNLLEQNEGEFGYYQTAPGIYAFFLPRWAETSLLFLPMSWKIAEGAVPGPFMWAIPARDLFVFANLHHPEAEEFMRNLIDAARHHRDRQDLISDRVFVWENNRFRILPRENEK
ncbi:MAG: hypothetical protein GXO27_07505 [Chlorobi bacterium]|nr:hypothetical protein [Chlorobiota bacterium]